jgi:signal peptidase
MEALKKIRLKLPQVKLLAKLQKSHQLGQRILKWFGIVLAVVSLPIILINGSIALQNQLNPKSVPTLFGIAPMVVLSNSMKTNANAIQKGDMIFAQRANNYQKGDIILFQGEKTNMTTIHRIVDVTHENGKTLYTTKGDANNSTDMSPVAKSQIVGKYLGRVPKLGNTILFFKTTKGMFVCLGIPFILLLMYDLFGRELGRKLSQKSQLLPVSTD